MLKMVISHSYVGLLGGGYIHIIVHVYIYIYVYYCPYIYYIYIYDISAMSLFSCAGITQKNLHVPTWFTIVYLTRIIKRASRKFFIVGGFNPSEKYIY